MWPRYELFNAHGHSCPSLPYLSHNITFSFMALALSFRIRIFSAHIGAYIVSFDSHIWTLKFDILRPRYELCDGCGHCCFSQPYLSHNITFSFMALALSFRIWIFSDHIVAYVVSFDSHIWTLKSDIIRPRYELFNAWSGGLSHCVTSTIGVKQGCPLSPTPFWIYIDEIIDFIARKGGKGVAIGDT